MTSSHRTTNFQEFIEWQNLGPEDFEEVLDLYETVRQCETSTYHFEETPKGQMLITSTSGNILVIANENAREAFCKFIEDNFASAHHGSVEMWAGFERAMANPHS